MKWHHIAVAASACALSAAVDAQPVGTCVVAEASLVRSEHFRDLQLAALDLNRQICLAAEQGHGADFDLDPSAHYLNFARTVREVATTALDGLPIDDLSIPFDRFVADAAASLANRPQLPAFRVELGDATDDWLIFHFDDRGSAGRLTARQDNIACRSRFNDDCEAVLDDLANAINYYRYGLASRTAEEAAEELGRLSGQWDVFLESGRSQTFLDLTMTTVLERKQFQQGALVGPPKRQWTVLHPDLAFEHVRRAQAGQKDTLSLVIEWFGVNWWSSNSPLAEMPFGVSLVSVYADRPGMRSAGHGVVFHFDNRYSIGWTRRRGFDGVFVSIDLLRLIDNKRERLNRYRRRLE